MKANELEIGNFIYGVSEFNLGKKTNMYIDVDLSENINFVVREEITETFYSKDKIFDNNRMVDIDKKSFDDSRQFAIWEVVNITGKNVICENKTNKEKISFFLKTDIDFEIVEK